jgi:hypothetical protein
LQDNPSQDLLAANDMGLPFGGKFDIFDDWNASSSHVAHDFGTASDIRGNGGSYSLPTTGDKQAEFMADCYSFYAADARTESVGTSNQHVHCRWPY